MTDENSAENPIESILCIRDSAGRPAIRIGLVATVYFEHGFTRPVREAVADLAGNYLNQWGDRLRWIHDPETKYIHQTTSADKKPAEWLPQHPEGESWSIGYFSGDHDDGAAEYQIKAFSADNVRPHAAFFSLHLPIDHFTRHGGTLVGLLLPICQRLNPVSGYAGFGILESYNTYKGGPGHGTVRQLAEKYPCLEVDDRIGTTLEVHNGIKGINWLTVLSNHWVEKLGGLDYLRIRLDEPIFPFYRYDGGIIIQAGAKPQFGDAERGIWPKPYVTLAKVLKPIQIKGHPPFHNKMQWQTPFMDKEATLAWLFRFDGK